jgi:phosphate transport system ATP-binding protein
MMPATGSPSPEIAHRPEPVAFGEGILAEINRGGKVEPKIHEAIRGEVPILEIDRLDLFYGSKQALFETTLSIPRGKVTALVGPSGCGKSTLLRTINRLTDLNPQVRISGDVRLNGESIFDRGVKVIDLRKRLGMVFQKSNPFPMSVYENAVYALRIDGERRRKVLDEACEQALRAAALWDEVKDRLQENALDLSGGQQQRLCIARALAAKPEVLLMDEPCSALDPIATAKIEELVAKLAGEYSIVIVTHNMQQASRASDYCAFLYLGRLIEAGPTLDLFSRPMSKATEDYVSGRFG